MLLTLTRFAYTPTEVEGVLVYGERRLFTIEKPWRGNKWLVSCVPDGTYTLEPFVRANGKDVFRLVAPDLRVFPDDASVPTGVPGRSYIYIHPANFEDELAGCIAVGLARGVLMDPDTREWKRGVLSSNSAFSLLRQDLKDGTHTLIIKPAMGAEL